MAEFYLRIRGDIWVNVPTSIRKLTTYVLLEQEDWFEKELRFLRRWLQPGMRAIDIGANHGVYSLSMAKLVAPAGLIYAFEPTRATAASLTQSIAKNRFDNLRLLPIALSCREGTASFYTYTNSELNSFTRTAADGEVVEEVAVSTLDRQYQAFGWDSIDFVKIDTEGEEINVIDGGREFFAQQSPLVMFEIPGSRQAAHISPLLAKFHEIGYDTYRLIGPDSLLVPLGENANVDGFDLNYFACKPDRAARLADAGFLTRAADYPSSVPGGNAQALFERQSYAPAFGPLVFADEQYRSALDFYAAWRDLALPHAARHAALERAFELIRLAAKSQPTVSRLSSLARIAFDAGARTPAVDAIGALINQLIGTPRPPDEPFFLATSRFDTLDPQQATRSWLLAATFEAGEQNRCYSGYFETLTDTTADLYEWLSKTPFHSPEMERRRQLLRLAQGKQPKLVATPLLVQPGPDNLNSAFWTAR